MAIRKRDDEVLTNAAGSDNGASSHRVAVPRHLAEQAGCKLVRKAGALTDDLNALADWLLVCDVDTVSLASIGVVWIRAYEVPERRGLTVCLLDARQMKYAPGRQCDAQNCNWLQTLMSAPRPAASRQAPRGGKKTWGGPALS